MSTPKHVRHRGAHRKVVLGVGFLSALGLAAGVTINANAAEAGEFYDPVALNTSCAEPVDGLGKADRCRFEPASRELFSGPPVRITGDTVNCTDVDATKAISWSQTTTEESSIQVSASVSGTISEVFSVSISTTFGQSWSFSTTESRTETAPVPAKSVAWIERQAPLQRVTGRMVINYPKRRHGHFEWYTYPTLTAAAPDALDKEAVLLKSRPATADELATQCGLPPGSAPAAPDAQPVATTALKVAAAPSTDVVNPNLNTAQRAG